MVYRWTQKLHSWLYPPVCLLCGAPGEADRDLCPGCHADLPVNAIACSVCALPLAGVSPETAVCGHCQRQPPAFDRALAPLRYQPPVDFLIQGLKFHGRLSVARLLVDLLGEALQHRRDDPPECLVPVPLHPSRLRERGFNQALEIARPLSRRLGVPVLADGVQRVRSTTPQSGLDRQARLANVRGVFSLTRPIPARHVAIVDDVVTTGSTVGELARVLRRAGVERIEVWAAARTAQNP